MAKAPTHPASRLFEKIIPEPNSGCWLWAGSVNGDGYGKIFAFGGPRYAHRVSYEIHKGPIPQGMQIDHLCRNPACVNPDHLEAVSNRENTLRGRAGLLRPARDRCRRGHDLRETKYMDSRGTTQCKVCLYMRQKAYHQRKATR